MGALNVAPKGIWRNFNRRDNVNDTEELSTYDIPPIDLVIVDLYPFEETVALGGTEQEIIEKIDIGGIALIRAAAKNQAHVVCIASKSEYKHLLSILMDENGTFTLEQRKYFAKHSFNVISL